MSSVQNLLRFGGEMYVYEHFFSKEESDRYFNILFNEIPWRQDDIVVFGKKYLQPRLTAMLGDPGTHYAYSGRYASFNVDRCFARNKRAR